MCAYTQNNVFEITGHRPVILASPAQDKGQCASSYGHDLWGPEGDVLVRLVLRAANARGLTTRALDGYVRGLSVQLAVNKDFCLLVNCTHSRAHFQRVLCWSALPVQSVCLPVCLLASPVVCLPTCLPAGQSNCLYLPIGVASLLGP